MDISTWNGMFDKEIKVEDVLESEENDFNESVKGDTAFSNPYDDSKWDGE